MASLSSAAANLPSRPAQEDKLTETESVSTDVLVPAAGAPTTSYRAIAAICTLTARCYRTIHHLPLTALVIPL